MQDQQSLLNEPQWGSKDKSIILAIQKGVSVLCFFLSIILSTNLFLLQEEQKSLITNSLAWTSVFIALYSVVSLYWCFFSEKKLQISSESSDNVFSRIQLFFAIVLAVQFLIYAIVFEFAHGNLHWYVQNHLSQSQVEKFSQDVQNQLGWIQFLTLSINFLTFFTVFSTFALSGSQITSRLQVYLVGILLTITCFQQLFNKRYIEDLYNQNTLPIEYPLKMAFVLAIITIIILFFNFLTNAKRQRLAYLLIGTFYLVTTALQISTAGAFFKDYQNQAQELNQPSHINDALSAIDAKYLEENGCPNKYQYKQGVKCPQEVAQNCFHDFENCDMGYNVDQVWETYLKPQGYVKPVFACVNTPRCGGIVKALFTEPLLVQAIYSLQYIFYCFILACFCYQLSSQDRGNQQINRMVQLILLVTFVVILTVGGIYLAMDIEKIPRENNYQRTINFSLTETIQLNDQLTLDTTENFEVSITQDSSLSGYQDESGCRTIAQIFDSNQATFINALQPNPENQKVQTIGDLDALLHYDDIEANNQCVSSDQKTVLCQNPGYLIVIQSTIKENSCPKQPQFSYHHSGLKSNHGVHMVSASSAESLLQSEVQGNPSALDQLAVQTLKQGSMISFMGTNVDVLNQLSRLTVCYLGGCKNSELTFKLRVIKLDLQQFGIGKENMNDNIDMTSDNDMMIGEQLIQEDDDELTFKHKSLRHSHLKGAAKTTTTTKKSSAPKKSTSTNKSTTTKKSTTTSDKKSTSKPTSKSTMKSPSQSTKKSTPAKVQPPIPKSTGPIDKSKYNIWGNRQFDLQVYDIITGKPIKDAQVLIYRVDSNANYDGMCQDLEHYNYQSELNATTTQNGYAGLKILFGPSIAPMASQVKIDNYITYYIHVTAANYNVNCRQISLGYETIKNYHPLRIALNEKLMYKQSRAILEWDNQFVNDLYLWASFGGLEQSAQENFDCLVGPFSKECQGLVFHQPSDSDSASSITFNIIGHYNYLVYFNRFKQGIQDDQINQRITNFAQQISQAAKNGKSINPIIKYYTDSSEYPNFVTSQTVISESDMDKLDQVSTDKKGRQTAHSKFAILEFCLTVKENNSYKAIPFSSKNYLWSQYQGYGIYAQSAVDDAFPDINDLNDQKMGICEQLTQQN